MKIAKNRIVGVVCGALSIAYLSMATQIPETTMEGDPGPQLFPYIAGILMLLSSVAMLLRKPKASDLKPWLNKEQFIRLWSLFGVMVIYVLMLSWIGYTIPTFLIVLIVCLLFARGRAKVPVWQAIIYSVIVTVLVYILFTQVLSVSLPLGKIKWLNFLTKIF